MKTTYSINNPWDTSTDVWMSFQSLQDWQAGEYELTIEDVAEHVRGIMAWWLAIGHQDEPIIDFRPT